MNRPKSAFAALLLSVVIVAPAAAQQAPLAPQPTVSEFCSGCFAYLEFPPLRQAEATSILASVHQGTLPPTTAARESQIAAPALSLVVSSKH